MREQDKKPFSEMYTGLCVNYGKDPSKEAMRFFYDALQGYSLDQVRQALTAHVMTSRYMPTVADVIERIAAATPGMSRPAADEAWMRTPAETDSYWATDEMLGAWAVVAGEMNSPRPDRVAARVAFRDAYNRLVAEAQAQGRPVRWQLVRGTRHDNLEHTVREGLRLGYLPRQDADEILRLECESAKPATLVPLLQGAVASQSEAAKEAITALKAMLKRPQLTADIEQARADCEARDRMLDTGRAA